MTTPPPPAHDVGNVSSNTPPTTSQAPSPPPAQSAPSASERPSFDELHRKFREFKHSTNNALAIVMALSEMTARNPDHAKRLVQVVAEKGPQVVSQLRELDEIFKRMQEQPPAV